MNIYFKYVGTDYTKKSGPHKVFVKLSLDTNNGEIMTLSTVYSSSTESIDIPVMEFVGQDSFTIAVEEAIALADDLDISLGIVEEGNRLSSETRKRNV